MSSSRRIVIVSFALGVALIVQGACTANRPDACTVDTDCPPGSFCRASLCAAVTNDAGTDSSIVTCGTPDNPCPDSDSGAGSSGGPTCKDVYALCSGDFECCPGLSCTGGACR